MYARQKKGWRRRGGFVLNITSKETRLPVSSPSPASLQQAKLLSRPVVASRGSSPLLRLPLKDPEPPAPTPTLLYQYQTGGGVEQRAPLVASSGSAHQGHVIVLYIDGSHGSVRTSLFCHGDLLLFTIIMHMSHDVGALCNVCDFEYLVV